MLLTICFVATALEGTCQRGSKLKKLGSLVEQNCANALREAHPNMLLLPRRRVRPQVRNTVKGETAKSAWLHHSFVLNFSDSSQFPRNSENTFTLSKTVSEKEFYQVLTRFSTLYLVYSLIILPSPRVSAKYAIHHESTAGFSFKYSGIKPCGWFLEREYQAAKIATSQMPKEVGRQTSKYSAKLNFARKRALIESTKGGTMLAGLRLL
jgi:hypothetical protein